MTKRSPLRADGSLHALAKLHREVACEERLELLYLLAGGPLEVSGLCARLDLDMPVVSGHLGHLKRLGLLERRVEGRWRVYSLSAAVQITRVEGSVELVLKIGNQMRGSFTVPTTALRWLTPQAPAEKLNPSAPPRPAAAPSPLPATPKVIVRPWSAPPRNMTFDGFAHDRSGLR